MALSVWQKFVTDGNGNPISDASVEVRDPGTTTKNAIYKDRAGTDQWTNNVATTDADGFVRLYVAAGIYDIFVDDGSGHTATYENVLLLETGKEIGNIPVYEDDGAGNPYLDLGDVLFARVSSTGGSSTSYHVDSGLYDRHGVLVKAYRRSYNLSVMDRNTMLWDSHETYDVYGDANEAGRLASDLNALGSSKIVFIGTHDEPQNNRTTNGLPAAIYRCGGSSAVFESAGFAYRSSYILVGIPDLDENNGIELYSGDSDSSPDAWCETLVMVQGGFLHLGWS